MEKTFRIISVILLCLYTLKIIFLQNTQIVDGIIVVSLVFLWIGIDFLSKMNIKDKNLQEISILNEHFNKKMELLSEKMKEVDSLRNQLAANSIVSQSKPVVSSVPRF